MSSRRRFIIQSAQASASLAFFPDTLRAMPGVVGKDAGEIGYVQAPLEYGYSALEPSIDAMTMDIHFTKHAAGYTKNMSDALLAEKVDTTAVTITDLLNKISQYSTKMRNNAGGHYNHELFWKSLRTPRTFNMPDEKLLKLLQASFGSFDSFQTQFAEAAKSRFGSGWAWLYLDQKKELQIGSTPNQDNPLMDVSTIKGIPLLGLDVWEHAYYLKYQNRRVEYVNNWFGLINWNAVDEIFLKNR